MLVRFCDICGAKTKEISKHFSYNLIKDGEKLDMCEECRGEIIAWVNMKQAADKIAKEKEE